jgi:hypothetical protein
MTNEKNKKQILEQLSEAIDSLRFGSIEITLHEGRVTQIEKREKIRLNDHNEKNHPKYTVNCNQA